MAEQDWIWQGYPGHFCDALKCCFHLSTVVGNGRWIVSTIGDYRPNGRDKDMVSLVCDENSYFETMVFSAEECGCGCSVYTSSNWSEVDCRRCATPKEASDQHMEICREYDVKGEE